jgi:AraC-like DNA-binding protein
MKEMQFTAVVLTLMMAMILMTMLPAEVRNDRVANRLFRQYTGTTPAQYQKRSDNRQ